MRTLFGFLNTKKYSAPMTLDGDSNIKRDGRRHATAHHIISSVHQLSL